ncbi:MAG: amidohydrolase [Pseudodesulfovibrio sp.]|uniref:Amidohydrolase n=1 Tax=Pseudodesulfovibrio aespoeensis (strain ATCC 700646 / DSM 10631 / Aspo-2) TaxID=643562 RepID=E6VYZ0_PSEA9|nr:MULTISPECIES: amidohydrolase [Pseudodesulfovibrio]MBU4379128.1 amidohydrolase [Pseudomonadota bacterium]ADU61653.1 amidohydrolase [Pseudodesulfovibrio aespoeensis Aspo-2]MBU4474077.1 amidohydrolase [Pseudomonadota bacterium]MBU4517756.1 amidohydrolase [Pseudomonadota bacterium]MBU4522188.1 amidohydrolase [Pseudomonadota bacterium]
MNLKPEIAARFEELQSIRRHLHTCPEVGLETVETVAFVKTKLDSFGIGYEDIGVNSLLAKVEGRGPGKTVAFRADMDGLETTEETGLPYQSSTPGRMHACGHDGHTTTMLAFARYLADHHDFDGTVLLLFQSGEEGFDGALKIIEDGLFEKYDIDCMFGLHNWPGYAENQIVVHPGPCMASEDRFDLTIQGKSGHASVPHLCVEPFAAVADFIKGAQSVVARRISAHDKAVVSITQVHGGSAYNIIPGTVVIRGNVRTTDSSVQDIIEQSLGRLAEGVAAMYGVQASFNYHRKHPVLVNTMPEPAIRAAARVVGKENVLTDELSAMGSEDYAFFMQHAKGCFVWVGNGKNSPVIHNSKYDFNDQVILVGASFFAELLEEVLPQS